jgi:hypothetical protein
MKTDRYKFSTPSFITIAKVIPVVIFALFQSCEPPADPYNPTSLNQKFGWNFGGEWKLDDPYRWGPPQFHDSSVLDCNGEKYNLYTKRQDSSLYITIDTINWKQDSTFIIRWNEFGKINTYAPGRPTACGGFLNKDSIVENTWIGKIDSFQYLGQEQGAYNYSKYLVHLSNGNSPKIKLILRSYRKMYEDDYNTGMDMSIMFENDEKEYLRREMFRAGWGIKL